MKGFLFSDIICKFDKVAKKCAAYKEGITPKNSLIFMTGMPGHYIQDVSFNNIQLETNGGAQKEDFENVVVPELDLEYLNGWWAGIYTFDRDDIVVPSHGIYARHVEGLYLNNIQMSTKHKDERPGIFLDDVRDFHKSNLFNEGEPIKRKEIHKINHKK